jgi:hypothetical protein
MLNIAVILLLAVWSTLRSRVASWCHLSSAEPHYRSVPKGRPTGQTLRHKTRSVASPNWAALCVTPSKVVLEFCCSEPALRIMQSKVVLESRRSRAALRVTVSKVVFKFRLSGSALHIMPSKVVSEFCHSAAELHVILKVAAIFFSVTRLE